MLGSLGLKTLQRSQGRRQGRETGVAATNSCSSGGRRRLMLPAWSCVLRRRGWTEVVTEKMGRARLSLKRISNERLRKSTFRQRSKVLVNKMSEISKLCDVSEACLIVYDADGDPQPVTWPEDPTKVHSIIDNYEREKNKNPPQMFGIQDYFESKKDSVEDDISKVRKDILKIKYPTWDSSLDNLGNQQLMNFIAMLNTKIEACSQRVSMLKKQQQAGVMNSANQVNVPLDCTKQSDAAKDYTNPLGEPDWASLLDEPIERLSELGGTEDWTSQLGEVMNWATLPDESQNLQQGATSYTLTPPMDEFQTDDYNNMLQAKFFNHMVDDS